jgi:hypothetical protein
MKIRICIAFIFALVRATAFINRIGLWFQSDGMIRTQTMLVAAPLTLGSVKFFSP